VSRTPWNWNSSDARERALRAIIQCRRSLFYGMFWGAAQSKLSRANLYMRTLLHVALTPQETELYLMRREPGME
jgi:hypothetical protein